MPGHENVDTLPVEVHRHGEPTRTAKLAESTFLARIRIPPRALLASMGDGPFARHVVQGSEDMAAIAARLAARFPDDPRAERACDALERAASEPGGHVVVIDGDAVAVIRRGIECHFVGDGFLHAARIAYEVVATFEAASEELCVHAAACLVADLLAARSSLADAIEATLGLALSGADNVYRPMPPRLECLVRAGGDADPAFVADLVTLSSGELPRMGDALDEGNQGLIGRLCGPYLSGGWFLPDGDEGLPSTRDGFRMREALRGASLQPRSYLDEGMAPVDALPPEWQDGLGSPDGEGAFHACLAGGLQGLSAITYVHRAEAGTPLATFGAPRPGPTDPRDAVVQVQRADEPSDCIALQVRRTLSPSMSDGLPTIRYRLRVVRTLGTRFASDEAHAAVAAFVLRQVCEDALSLVPGLAVAGARLDIGVAVPPSITDDVLSELDGSDFLRNLAGLFGMSRDRFSVALDAMPEDDPVGAPAGRPAPYQPLPGIVDLDPGMLVDGARACLREMTEFDAEPDHVEILRPEGLDGGPAWLDPMLCDDGGVSEPFVLARAWHGSLAYPMALSTVSGRAMPLDAFGLPWLVDDFVAAMAPPVPATDPGSARDACQLVEEAARQAFRRVDVFACPHGTARLSWAGRANRILHDGETDAEHLRSCAGWLADGFARQAEPDAPHAPGHVLALAVPVVGRGIAGGRHPAMFLAKHLGRAASALLGYRGREDAPRMVLAEAVAGAYLDETLPDGVPGAEDRLASVLAKVRPDDADALVRALNLVGNAAVGPRAPLHMAVSRVAHVIDELTDDGRD